MGRKKIYVSSVIYNLAGEYDERTDYIKHLVMQGVMSGNSVGSTLVNGTIHGPRSEMQNYFKWAKRNYPMGMPMGGIFKTDTLRPDQVLPFLEAVPPYVGWDISIYKTGIVFADYFDWASKWVVANFPDRFHSNWTAEINDDNNLITVIWEDETTDSFVPLEYNFSARYVQAHFNYTKAPDPLDPGVLISSGSTSGPIALEIDLPDLAKYELIEEYEIPSQTKNLTEVETITEVFSDGRPDVVTVNTSSSGSRSYTKFVQHFRRLGVVSQDPLDLEHLFMQRFDLEIWKEPRYEETLVEDVVVDEPFPGVTRTTTTVTVTQDFSFPAGEDWYWKEDLYQIDWGYKSTPQLFQYMIGSGRPELDALDTPPEDQDGYFPMIPVRTHNKMVNHEDLVETVYPDAKKAWKRASGGKLIKLIEKVEDNANLGDIDHAFLINGVCLNNITQPAKLYIRTFFNRMYAEQVTSIADYEAFLALEAEKQAYSDAYELWLVEGGEEPIPPASLTMKAPARTQIRVHCPDERTNHYDFRVEWRTMTDIIIPGLIDPEGTETNYVKLQKGIPQTWSEMNEGGGVIGMIASVLRKDVDDCLEILWQENQAQHRMLRIYGLKHVNKVYGGKSVDTTSDEALDDGDDSGFIIPFHYSTMRMMPLKDTNQLCLENTLIVFNCYVIVKKKWYQTFLGQLFIVFVFIAAAAVFTGGASLFAGGGILGSNVAIGGLLGMNGLAGALVGAMANALAGMIITQILNAGLVKIFGAKWGAILSAVFSIVMGGFSKGLLGGEFNFSFNTFLRADNLLKLTNSVLTAISIHIQEMTQGVFDQMSQDKDEYDKANRDLMEQALEVLGTSANFDPMALTDFQKSAPRESSDTFLSRTLLTGSDIAELTHSMITDFSAINLDMEPQ